MIWVMHLSSASPGGGANVGTLQTSSAVVPPTGALLLVPAAKRGTSLGLTRVFLICVEVFSHLM